jgi:hypothetical protein
LAAASNSAEPGTGLSYYTGGGTQPVTPNVGHVAGCNPALHIFAISTG